MPSWGIAQKTLATPGFGLKAELSGGELMNIGWEWGVALPIFMNN